MNIVLPVSLAAFFFGLFGVNWEAVDRRIERQFPEIETIEIDELRARQEAGTMPLLIDVRELEEYQVSHLPGARHLASAEQVAGQVPDTSREIVVYCSIGYRSAQVAQELREAGYSNVRNLRRSIFAWANAGYPLVDNDGPTDSVHPYNRVWGQLLDDSRHHSP